MVLISFTTAHRWNSLLCPPLGFFFNFLLLWLIIHRTPKEMRVHSRILLQTCLLDNLLLALQCIGQNVFTIDKKASCFVHFCDGYFVRQFKMLQTPLTLIILFSIWTFLHNLGVLGIAIQFFYRYLSLNRNMKISMSKYLLFVSGTALCIFGMSMSFLLGMISTNVQNQHPIDRQRFEAFVDFEQQRPLISYTIEIQGFILIGAAFYAILYTIAYMAICLCGWKMVRFVSKNATLTGQLKELNRQLTRSLIILACIPMFFAFISIILLYDTFFQQDGTNWTLEWKLYLALAMHFLPVLNPLVTIYVNRPYRDALIGRFLKISPAAANG